MEPAPLYRDIADGPADGTARWLRAADGVRLRIALWGRDAPDGTVLLFCGRTEFAEKYGRAARDFRDRGLATVAVDWRGQGLADRLHGDARLGHVDRFDAYQCDVDAVQAAVRDLGLPRPFFLLGHSMGGAIGLRALMRGLDVAAAAFSAPMWGISMAPALRPVAWTLSAASRPLGLGGRYTPGKAGDGVLLDNAFEGNDLTTDPEMFAHMRRQLTRYPELAVSGPSLAWLHEALRESRQLIRAPVPDLPVLTWLGTDERIVCPEAIRVRMDDWPEGRLELIRGARHEVMMERPEIRARVFDQAAEHFLAHARQPV
ncbi:alpha/beta fold hydrolase [Rhodovulum adriaticum]|uniref:Lysophospholipase n=1 Tax=Rhodovulum adriaticum TaxID=35804 RepID=A0A4R2NJJ5_RHOAD|nr:alpha/beta hydrolase [Rhodovulum adriaticum]MBK1634691.1 lysophospholipase [Rhodovulum adriaticum]TCP21601.1 lysophospholipase [Rhodovulum adriaticum]